MNATFTSNPSLQAVGDVAHAVALATETPREASSSSSLVTLMGAVFFCSGLSSLIYEVVWMRRLALFFGSDIYSAALTLSAFMGGLTLGSLLAARYVDRLRKLLVCYGGLEITIGVYAFFFPALLNAFSGQYRHIYQTFFDSAPWRYNGFRILVASVTLLIPTTLMGATLPLIVKRFGEAGKIGRYSGFFYAINTLGALSGVLLAGFVLMPFLGTTRSTWTACAINLLIGAGAVLLGFGTREDLSLTVSEQPSAISEQGYDTASRKAALIAIALSGMAALALEVVWMRILIQSFSATVYAFAIMLSCFLFGIFYGSEWISKRVDQHDSLPRLFGLLELALGVSVASLATLTCFVPPLFTRLLYRWFRVSEANFGSRYVVAQFVVSACLIVVPTLLLGATFPVAARIWTRHPESVGRGVATVYAANTVGAIVGALLGGMVLIPAMGARKSLLVIAAIFVSAGLLLLFRRGAGGGGSSKRLIPAALLLFFVSVAVGLMMPQQIVSNFITESWVPTKVIYHGEGIAHNVDIVRFSNNATRMSINGAGEADTSYVQRRHFILKAHLPLLLHPDPKDVAVVGLGLGITLSATNRNPNVQNIQVIELTREMVRAQRYLEDVSGGVLHSPKVHVRIDDGRNFMAMSDRSFDMITADPIHPRNTGVGYLYTREYYESIKRRLRPQGVVCQWMPMYEMSKKSFDVAFRTFVSVFPNASFWYVKGHGLFVATIAPFQIDYQDLSARMQNPIVKADLDSIAVHSPPEFLALMLMGPDEIARYLASTPDQSLNTDDNAYLEYHTPFELLQPPLRILDGLLPFAGLDLRDVHNMSSQETDQVRQAWELRKAEILPEWKAPKQP
jgi:spermidine synthase